MPKTLPTAAEPLDFWFQELEPAQWFRKDAVLDARIRERFLDVHRAAAAGELWQWRGSPAGRLAEILVLDQFSRNLFRDSPDAFAQDAMALVLAQEAVAQGADRELDVAQRVFLYMPYMHSESLRIHDEALHLFDQPGMEENLRFEHRHRDILLRFGRYPHRNAILGRDSTPEEVVFLAQPGSSF
ncbi:DUF924 domain-containing protein [Halomonas campisalis]|uniref:DUF924 domain-containing protein n=1 Tax=Billgrantia campisalis TaxID=74661 RepID=A0ABS9P6J3_9GAMM|nr:DUF924 family protein [Halomonas campisalis]MCG6657393.1 DUF924 domain-containing protein [Halomonas campisalis]MDR5863262.1 DUF924 domain-containing protein [Halomonas campisalis]